MSAVLDPYCPCVMVEATRLEDTTDRFDTSCKRRCRRWGQMGQAQRVEKKLGNHLVFLHCHGIRHRFESVGGLRRLDSGIWYVHAGDQRRSGVLTPTCTLQDLTYPDIVIATLFFQFSLYVSVRLARRGFTLGELGIICHAATGLFMETVNLTRTRVSEAASRPVVALTKYVHQINFLTMPYIKAYRLPTPLLIFQLALIPGSLLTGFLLSPLLVLSRKIAQRPAHRLRHPQEKELYRKALAAGFYSGAAAICGGLIGFWAKWLLGWRDPWVWVACWLLEGRRWWTRPILIAYWGLLAAISVAGWTRQLGRARKRRAWLAVTNTNGHSRISVQNSATQAGLGNQQNPSRVPAAEPGFGHVASQMMDAANQKLPVLSINARRKFFHALATAMFVPGIIIDVSITRA